MQDKGFVPKSRSLEKVLKSSPKMKAKLIGYNEIPIEIAPINSTEHENLIIQEPSVKRFIAKSHSGTEQSSSPSSCKVNNSETTKHIDPDTSLTNGIVAIQLVFRDIKCVSSRIFFFS